MSGFFLSHSFQHSKYYNATLCVHNISTIAIMLQYAFLVLQYVFCSAALLMSFMFTMSCFIEFLLKAGHIICLLRLVAFRSILKTVHSFFIYRACWIWHPILFRVSSSTGKYDVIWVLTVAQNISECCCTALKGKNICQRICIIIIW